MTSEPLTEAEREWSALRNALSKAYTAKDIDAALATARPRIEAAERERIASEVERVERKMLDGFHPSTHPVIHRFKQEVLAITEAQR